MAQALPAVPHLHGDLGTEDGPQPLDLLRAESKLHRPGERVVICQGERPMAQQLCLLRKLVRHARAVKEGVGGVGVELNVGRGAWSTGHSERMFA